MILKFRGHAWQSILEFMKARVKMFMPPVVGYGCFLESHITQVLWYTIHGTWEEKFGDPAQIGLKAVKYFK